jgi:hypothetical protein
LLADLDVSSHGAVLRIGYVDMKQVLDNAPQVVAGRELLDREFRSRSEAIEMDEFRKNTRRPAVAGRYVRGEFAAG